MRRLRRGLGVWVGRGSCRTAARGIATLRVLWRSRVGMRRMIVRNPIVWMRGHRRRGKGRRVGRGMEGRLRRGLGGDVGGDIVRMRRKSSRTYGGRRGGRRSGGRGGGGRSRATLELGRARVDGVWVQRASQHLAAVDLFRRPVVDYDGAHVKLIEQQRLNVATGRISTEGIGGQSERSEREEMRARSRATRKRGFTFDDEGLGPGGFKDQSADQVLPRQEGVRLPADPSHWKGQV